MNADPTPLTLVAGYLGAGKTTLINQLLRRTDGLRLAILVNDFGDIGIDAALIEAREGPVISLAGGCVCCSFGSDLIGALVDLGRSGLPIDHIVVEASGVGLPAAIARAVALLAELRFDGTVVLADAETVRARAEDGYVGDLVRAQLSQADLVVLNKVDLLDAAGRERMREWLARAAPGAPVLESVEARLEPAVVLGGLGPRRQGRADHGQRGTATGRLMAPGRWPRVSDDMMAHASTRFLSRSYRLRAGTDAEPLARALAEAQLGIVRAKGLVTGRDGQRRALHVVGRRHTLAPAPRADAAAADRLVLIALRERCDAAALDALLAGHGAVPG